MKYFIILILTVFAFAAQAQTPEQMEMLKRYQSMTPEQLQAETAKMQKDMTKVANCMQGVDMEQMNKLKTRGEAVSNKIQALCAQGKESEAEAYAMEQHKTFMSDPTIQKAKKCSKHMSKHFDFTPSTKGGKRKSICEK